MKTVYISYSSQDHKHCTALITHLRVLQRRGIIQAWHDSELLPGMPWKTVIDEKLRTSDIIIFLVSADFLASPFCQEVELSAALKRWLVQKVTVVPVIVRDCDWLASPLGGLHVLPDGALPVERCAHPDEAWATVTRYVRLIAEGETSSAAAPPEVSSAPASRPPPSGTSRSGPKGAKALAAAPNTRAPLPRSQGAGITSSSSRARGQPPSIVVQSPTPRPLSGRQQGSPKIRYYSRRSDITDLRARMANATNEINLLHINLGSIVDYVESLGMATAARPELRIRVLALSPQSQHLESRIKMMDADTGLSHMMECKTGISNFRAWARRYGVRYELRLYDEPPTLIMLRIDNSLILAFITANGIGRNMPHIELPGPRELPSTQAFIDHFEVLWSRASHQSNAEQSLDSVKS